MEIIFSFHAQEQIKERKIPIIWAEETIKYPDEIIKENSKYYAIKKLNGKTLKVVYIKERYIKVITLFFIK